MQVAHAVSTNAPPYHHRDWFLHFSLVTVWLAFHLWHVESEKNKLKCGLV